MIEENKSILSQFLEHLRDIIKYALVFQQKMKSVHPLLKVLSDRHIPPATLDEIAENRLKSKCSIPYSTFLVRMLI